MSDRPTLECRKCGHVWQALRVDVLPKYCPRDGCKSPFWSTYKLHPKLTCRKCLYGWVQLSDKPPLRCPNPQCTTKYWNKPVPKRHWPKMSASERFWSHVDIRNTDECWPWMAFRDNDGYGKFHVNEGRCIAAHRFCYEDYYGVSIPTELMGLHRCDNPPCCNPAHIYPGNQEQNMRDRDERKRTATGDRNGSKRSGHKIAEGQRLRYDKRPESFVRGELHTNAKLNADKVNEMRRLRDEGMLYSELGQRFNVTAATAQFVCTRKGWKHV